MALLDYEYKTADLPESQSFDPLPAGWYTAEVAAADLKDTKAGTGQYIAIQYSIIGPTHEGRVVFGNINIRNPNSVAEEIGRQQLGDLMRAIGLSAVRDTDQLIGGTCQIKLKIRKSEEYGDSNDVSGFKAVNGSAPAPTENKPAATDSAKPPWAK